ncbi:MAG: alpha/beta hydrolase family protein [Pseudomonadota bacterium]
MSQLQISPQGTYFSWVTQHNGRKHVVIKPRDPARGQALAIPPGEAAEIQWTQWANDDYLLISYGYDSQRIEFRRERARETRLVSVEAATGKVVNIVKPKATNRIGSRLQKNEIQAQYQDSVVDWLPDEPNHILLELNEDQDFASGFVIRKIDIRSGQYNIVASRRWVNSWMVDRSHQPRLGLGLILVGDQQKKYMAYRNPGTGDWVERKGEDVPMVTLLDFFADPRYAYAWGSSEEGRQGILKYDLVAERLVEWVYIHPEYDVEDVLLDPIDGRVIGAQYIADRPTNVYFDDKLQQRQQVLDRALVSYSNDIVSSTRDGKLHIVLVSSDVEPGIFLLYDEPGRQLTELGAVREKILPEHLSPMTDVTYKARDGLEIHAFLTVPKGREARNLPTVILPHGGPWARDYKRFDYLVQFLANRGYAVLQPNFRGSTGYGAAFKDAGHKQWGGAMQDDVTDGTQWLIDQGIADPRRICIVGASYGGYAALMGAVKTPDLFRCAVSLNGVSDLFDLIADDRRTIGLRDWIAMIGDTREDRESLEQNSPARQADKIKVPVLLFHAKDDTRVDVEQARNMARALKKRNKPVTLVEVEEGDHSLEIESARLAFLKALEAFLEDNLGPETALPG